MGFEVYGESHDGYTLALCGSCHETLHIALGAIVHKRKRASEVWNALVSALGKNDQYIKAIEERVYETAEMILELEIENYDY